MQQPMKQVSVKINNGGTLILIDCTFFKQRRHSLSSKQVYFEWKQNSLFNMIYLLLEKVIRYAQ